MVDMACHVHKRGRHMTCGNIMYLACFNFHSTMTAVQKLFRLTRVITSGPCVQF